MAFIHGRNLGVHICHVLGIDTATVSRITVDCDCKSAARITVERIVTEDEGDRLVKVLNEYRLADTE